MTAACVSVSSAAATCTDMIVPVVDAGRVLTGLPGHGPDQVFGGGTRPTRRWFGFISTISAQEVQL